MPPRKQVNKNNKFVQKAKSMHSMNLRTRSIVSYNGSIDRLGFDTKLSANSHSMTLRTRKGRSNVVAASKANTKIQKVVKKPKQLQIGESAQIETPNHIEPLQTISIRITTFDDLDDDCLLIIFGKFGLQELMLLRAISPRCLSIIERLFLGVRTLKLFDWHYTVREYFHNVTQLMREDDDFRLKPNEHEKNDDLVLNFRVTSNLCYQTYYADANPTTFLPRLFPNVSKLFILLSKDPTNPSFNLNLYQRNVYFHNQFSSLLRVFVNLSTLFVMNPPSYQNEDLLWHNIASKASLRSLYLFSLKSVFRIPTNIYHNLQQLTIVTEDKAGMDFVLPHLGPNCTQIAFYWLSWECEQLQAGLNLNRNNLKNTITHFSIGSPYFAYLRKDLLLSTCAQMKSLTFLQISLDSEKINLKGIFTQLASLPRLTELRIFGLNSEHLETGESKAWTFRPLPSITNLSLGILLYQISNVKFYILQDIFTKVFPSLIKATIFCNDETILNQSRECFSNARFPHLLQSSFYTDSDAMFVPSKYYGRLIRYYSDRITGKGRIDDLINLDN